MLPRLASELLLFARIFAHTATSASWLQQQRTINFAIFATKQ
jgi:hypothetical protein